MNVTFGGPALVLGGHLGGGAAGAGGGIAGMPWFGPAAGGGAGAAGLQAPNPAHEAAVQQLHPSAAQLAAIRACFAGLTPGDSRVLLHIDAANGLADAVRNDHPISAAERACLSEALGSLGLTTGGYALSL